MIDINQLRQIVEECISGTDAFIVDTFVTPDNRVTVEIDSDSGVDIDTCVAITRAIEAKFDRDVEDYELEVGSAGLTSPFKVREQYVKNIGNNVEVLTTDGRKLRGRLVEITPDGSVFTIEVVTKVKQEGKKRPVTVDTPMAIAVADTKEVKYLIEFK